MLGCSPSGEGVKDSSGVRSATDPLDAAALPAHDAPVIRPNEEIIFFPTLARPIGGGRWDARLHGVLFRPETGSIKRKLFVRAIARAAGVRHDEIAGPLLMRRLGAFLVDNKSRRKVSVVIGGGTAVLGPSSRNGHLLGRAMLAGPDAGAIDYVSSVEQSADRSFAGRVHLLPAKGLSMICDIDDTIKLSNVPDTRDLLRNTFLRPYRGVDAVGGLCRTLAGAGAAMHYVSASPWQLYGPLSEFIAAQRLPLGSFHLRTFRAKDRSALALLAPPQRFKLGVIEPMLRDWPERRFVLVGDSTEMDPEIYGELARRFPRQVVAVLIRNVVGEERDMPRYRSAFAGLAAHRWELLTDEDDWSAAAAGVLDRASTRVR